MSVADSAKVYTLHGSFSSGEGTWIQERKISEGKQGCNAKVSSWFNDEGVQMAVREWCAGVGERKFSRNFHLCT